MKLRQTCREMQNERGNQATMQVAKIVACFCSDFQGKCLNRTHYICIIHNYLLSTKGTLFQRVFQLKPLYWPLSKLQLNIGFDMGLS